MRAYRRVQRKRKIKQLEHMVYSDLRWVYHWAQLFDWSEDLLIREINEESLRIRRNKRKVLTATHKFNHKEPDYTAPKIIISERDAFRDLKNQAEEFGALHIRCPRRTGKDLW